MATKNSCVGSWDALSGSDILSEIEPARYTLINFFSRADALYLGYIQDRLTDRQALTFVVIKLFS